MRVSGRRVLITGAAGGIGRLMALECAKRGAEVVAWDIHQDRLDALMVELKAISPARHAGYISDVSNRKGVYKTADKVRKDGGSIDILINNAGIVSGAPLLEIPDERIEATFQVNTLALYWVTKAFLGDMVAANCGHVVTIASASGLVGVARCTDYAASKHAAVGFDESLRVELAKSSPGVKTTVVCPYFIDTGMFDGVKTRFPLLFPILKEQEVALAVINGVERGKRKLLLPPAVHLVQAFRWLPVPAFDAVANFFGVNISMDEFHGRAQEATTSKKTPKK
jgi:all-trans-retinol dehydrogenase (NAD+)